MNAAYVHDLVAVDDIALPIDREASVGVAIVGEAHVKALFFHEGAQALDVGRTAGHVDVAPVRRIVDDMPVCAQSGEHARSDS